MGYRVAILIPHTADMRGEIMVKMVERALPGALASTIRLSSLIPDYWRQKKNTKAVYEKGPNGPVNFAKVWAQLQKRGFTAFVCIDFAFAHYMLPERDIKSLTSIDKLAGMILPNAGLPVLMLFDPVICYGRQYSAEDRAGAAFMANFMLKKLERRIQGIETLERPVRFMLPDSVTSLKVLRKVAARASLIAADIETSSGYITCMGYALDLEDYVLAVCIPLSLNIEGSDGMYWSTDAAFNYAWDTIGEILANDVPKIFHNGGYDLTYIFRYGWVVNNFIYDTMVMMHSTWATLPRALYIGASLMLDNYRYWKDDGKDIGEDGKVKYASPKDAAGSMRYWYYNALDCVNTLELCKALLRLWDGHPQYPRFAPGYDYAKNTYVRMFALEFGPCFYMSMTGIPASKERQAMLEAKLRKEGYEKLDELRELIAWDNFNPNSAPQVAKLLYDDLQLRPHARKGRTTDKRYLEAYADLHPLFRDVIEAVASAKEPMNNAAKYGESLELLADQFYLCQFKAAATTTMRLSSSQSNLGVGSNAQNMPAAMRVFCHASPKTYLCSIDYGQSDSYFVAFESQDLTMIETVTDDRDTHSVHVEFFFGHKYEDVVKGAEKKEAWVVDSVSGVRQIIKKVSHGTNYDMGGETMLLNVRKEAAVAMVEALLVSPNAKAFMIFMGLDRAQGYAFYQGKAALWSDKQLSRACEFAQALYYARYKTLKAWKVKAVAKAQADHGLVTMFGGSTTLMMCEPKDNPRFVPAAYGQGGTAGNINNAMLRLFFLNEYMWKRGWRMMLQVHDELISEIPENDMELITIQQDIMETPCTVNGRTFVIPTEAEVTLTWTKKPTVKWPRKGVDNVDLIKYKERLAANEQATLAALGLKPATLETKNG
jgi:DNA polymerase I-like protein with 3'-5' exonuclease and polymerase domains